MTPLAIEYLPLEALTPYADNARTHSHAQVAQIAASIEAFGWTNPILVDELGGIIAGHGRVMAAATLQIDKVPCIRFRHLTKAQKRALILADNKLALDAGWDLDKLAAELAELEASSFDLGLTGFTELETASLIGETDAFEAQSFEDPAEAWEGMPEYTHEDQRPVRQLIVNFASDEDRQTFARLIGQKLTDKTKSVWYPEAVKVSVADKRYASTGPVDAREAVE